MASVAPAARSLLQSLSLNTSALPMESWTGYVEVTRSFLPSSWRLAVLCLVNTPVIIILINVLWQLVRIPVFSISYAPDGLQIRPKDPTLPPVVFHWFPFIGSAIAYGNDPIKLLLDSREKVHHILFFFFFSRDDPSHFFFSMAMFLRSLYSVDA